MKNNWEKSYEIIIKSEGGYQLTDIPGDMGGQTYAGIARKPNPGWEGWALIDKGQIPFKEMVMKFYKEKFWDKAQCDVLPSGVDFLVYDFGVNAGIGRSIQFMQSSVGAVPDGAIGPKTLALIANTNPKDLIDKFSKTKEDFYNGIVAKNPSQSKFIKGWLNRVKHSKEVAESMMA